MHIHTVHTYICTCVCMYVSMYLYSNVARVCGYLCEVVLVGWTKGLPEVRHSTPTTQDAIKTLQVTSLQFGGCCGCGHHHPDVTSILYRQTTEKQG